MDDYGNDDGESAQQGSRWALKSSDGANYPLFFGSNFVGRSSNTQNYLNIKCANVSIAYLHAEIEVSVDEYHCFVKDFRTLTGTFIEKASVVDGERVVLRQKVEYIRTAIEPGTIVYFGSEAFEVIRGGGDASTEDTPQQFQSVRADEETQLLDERLLQRANLSGIIGMRGAGAHVATAVLAGSIPSAGGTGMSAGTGIGIAGNRPIGILEQETQAIGIPEIEEEEDEDEEENVAASHDNNKKEEEAMEEEGGDLLGNGNPVEVRGSSCTRASSLEREKNSGLNVSERQESDDDSTDCDEEDVAKSAGNTSAVIALTSASAALEQQQQHGVIYGGYACGSGTAAEDDETGIEYNINQSNIFNVPSAAEGFAPAVPAHAVDRGGDDKEAEEEEEEGKKEDEASGAGSPASTNLLLGAAAGIDISAINGAERHSVEGGEGILSSSESPAGGDIEPVPGEEELPDPSTAIAAAAFETTTRAATMGKTETKKVIMAEVSTSSSGSSESGDRSSSSSSSNNGHETASSALGAAVGRLADAGAEVWVGSESGTGLTSEATGSTSSTGVLAGKPPAIGVVGSDLQARSSARSRRLPAHPAMYAVNEGAHATHTPSRPSGPPSSALVSSIAKRGGTESAGMEGSQSALSPSTAYAILSMEAAPAPGPDDKALSIEQEAATKIAADNTGSRRGKRALSDRIRNGNDVDADGDIGGDLKTKQRKTSRRKTTTTTPAQGRKKEAAGNSVEDDDEEGEDVDTVSHLKRSGSLVSAAQQARREDGGGGGGEGGVLLLLQEEGESAPRSKVSNCGMGERPTPNVSKPAARGGAVNVSSTKALAMHRGGVKGGRRSKVSPPTPLPPSSIADLAKTTVTIAALDAPTTALDDVTGGNAASELTEGEGLTKFGDGMSTHENNKGAPAAAVIVSGDVVLAASTHVLASSSNNNTADDQRIMESKVAPDNAAARTELTKSRGKRNSNVVTVVATDTDTAILANAASPSLLEDQQPPAKIAKRSGARKSTSAGRKRGVSSIDETADDDVAPASRVRGVKGGKKLAVSLSLSSPAPITPVVPSTAAIAATTATTAATATAFLSTSKGTTASASTPVVSASANMTEAQWVEEAHLEVKGAEGVVASSKKPAKAPKQVRSQSIVRGPLCEEDEDSAVANMEGAQAGSATAVVAVAAAEEAEEVPLLLEERVEAAVGKENAVNDVEKKDKRKTPVSRGKRASVSVKGSHTTSTVDTITAATAAEATTMNAKNAAVGQPIESATGEGKGATVDKGKAEAMKEVKDEKEQDNYERVDKVFFTGFDKESSAYLSALSTIETLPGLSVVDTPSEATHLVTYPDKTVKRTANLLIALNSGVRYVLDSRWVKRSAKLKRPAPIADLKSEFIVRDRAKEKEWGFDLAQSLSVSAERARVRYDRQRMIGSGSSSSSGSSGVVGNDAEGGNGVFTGVLFYITEGMGSASAVADMRSIIESGGGILCDSLPFLPPAACASVTHSNTSSGSKALFSAEEQTYDAIVISTAAALKDLDPKTKSSLLQALSHDIGSILGTSCTDSSSSKGSAIKRISSASKRRASSAAAPSPVPTATSAAVLDGKEGREDGGSVVPGREARQVEAGRVRVRGVFTRDAILLAVLRQAPIDFSENRLSVP